jgi:hypothetical protein
MLERPGSDGLAVPLEGERLQRACVYAIAHQAVRLATEQDLAWLRSLLQPCRNVDRITGRDRLPRRGIAGHHLAGVDPDPGFEPDAPARVELVVETDQRAPHLVGGPHRAEGIVLVQHGNTEDGHHGVADELLDRASVPFQHGAHLVEIAQHHAPQSLGFDVLAEVREARHITEHDGYRLPDQRLTSCSRHVPSLGRRLGKT